MSVFAGLWRFSRMGAEAELHRAASLMLAAQQTGAQVASFVTVSGQAGFARSAGSLVFRQLVAASQREESTGGAIMAVDVRIDNRAELFDLLNRPRDDTVDDASLFFLAYRRWRENLVDHVLGDYAAAAWDPDRKAITLFRDATGQRPLHYSIGGNFIAIASLPQGLLALEDIRSKLNAAQLGRFVAGLSQRGPESFYEDISRVEPAQIVRITRSGADARTYWAMPSGELRYRNSQDYVDAFREQLDRATQVRLRDAGPVVAAQLSAGLDSGAVAATAARLSAHTGDRVLAFTSAPRRGFAGPVPPGRIADESGIAAELVAQYANMDHVVVRSTERSPLSSLDADVRLFGQPIALPCNNVWWGVTNAAAQARGAKVMLTGEMGNLTISAGGVGVLADLVRTGKLVTWLREVIALEKGEPRWRGLLAASFAPWLSGRLWTVLKRFSASGALPPPVDLLTEAARRLTTGSAQVDAPRAGQSERELRWSLLRAVDPGNSRKGATLKWGIEERDPTADRRLVEFCFSLPPTQLVGGGMTRRLARTALADRLPEAMLNGPRGYQYADWYEALDRRALARFAKRIAVGPGAAVIDRDAVDRLIAAWPPGDWASGRTIATYRIGLLRALSAGAFALNAAA